MNIGARDLRLTPAMLFVFALLLALPCLADGQRWYVLNKDAACEPMAEIHNTLPGLAGGWTPQDLLKVVRDQYPDARLAPLLEGADRKKSTPRPALSETHLKYLTSANAQVVSAYDGQLNITLYSQELCARLGILPAGPDQWLGVPLAAGDALADGKEVPPANWFAVNDERMNDATRALMQKSLAEISESWAAFIAERRYMPDPDKHTFLVRGIRTATTGMHQLILRDGVLYVIFRSAEHDDHLSYNPLVVNLPEAPQSVAVLVQEGKP